MPVCENCGKSFDYDEEYNEFLSETYLLEYDNVEGCLCASCAIKAIDGYEDGVYFEVCEGCGKNFDFVSENGRFQNYYDGIDIREGWTDGIYCADCALKKFEKENGL
jgi:hypothetical protein